MNYESVSLSRSLTDEEWAELSRLRVRWSITPSGCIVCTRAGETLVGEGRSLLQAFESFKREHLV